MYRNRYGWLVNELSYWQILIVGAGPRPLHLIFLLQFGQNSHFIYEGDKSSRSHTLLNFHHFFPCIGYSLTEENRFMNAYHAQIDLSVEI